MVVPLSEEYEHLRNIVKAKKYDDIYSALLNEVKNIKDVGFDVKDTVELEKYIFNKTRELIFSSKGLPTYLIKITILMGHLFENDLREKVSSYMITNYSSEFQLFTSKNFKTLRSVYLLYKELNSIVKNFENKYFNMPIEWNILSEIMKSLYFIVKQKICDFFYFENIQQDDYFEAFTTVLSEEKKINKYIMISDDADIKAINSNEKNLNLNFYNLNGDPYIHMLFKLFIPHVEIYLEKYFENYKEPQFNVADNEIKIFTPFLSVFRSFEKLYTKITYFENEYATKALLEHLLNLINKMINCCNNQISSKIELLYELEESNEGMSPEHLRSIFEMIMIVLNTSEYIYDYVSEFCNTLSTDCELYRDLDSFNYSLGSLEKIFTQHLSKYISYILGGVDFDIEEFASYTICNLEKYIFDVSLAEIHEDVEKVLIEGVVIYILSSLYLIDFDVDKAEMYLGEMSQIKSYLGKYIQSIPLFNVLECYIKIFLCPADEIAKFVDNFLLLSSGIFSFDQIICSLTINNKTEELKNEYLRRVCPKSLELEKDTV